MLITLASLALPAPGAAVQAQGLQVIGPTRGQVGRPLEIHIRGSGPAPIGGFEARVLFSGNMAHLGTVTQRTNAIRQPNGDVRPLGPVELPGGVAFGFYSCRVRDCAMAGRAAGVVAHRSQPLLATVEVVPDRAGMLVLRLDGGLVVDPLGRPLLRDATATLQVIVSERAPTESTQTVQARGQMSLERPRVGSVRYDLTNDGAVTYGEAARMALAWTHSRQLSGRCTGSELPGPDVDRDGCVDVADVQSIAGRFTTTVTSPASRRGAASGAAGDGYAPSADREAATSLATWVVDSVADDPDAGYDPASGLHTPDGRCATAAGRCTLRAAIQEANKHVGPDEIRFAIPGDGVRTIDLASQLPLLEDETGGTLIDGYTQPGAAPNVDPAVSRAVIRIELRGPGEPGNTTTKACDDPTVCYPALTITQPGNQIRGIAIYRFWRKVWLDGPGARENVVAGSFIGTDATGTYVAPTLNQSGYGGIELSGGARYNRIGGPQAGDRNVISGNQSYGVHFTGEGTEGNRVLNNVMGLSPDGARRLMNRVFAVDLNFGASRNQIGGGETSEGNLISGNGSTGVEVSHGTNTSGNQILGNLIGTTADGTAGTTATANGFGGVHIEDGVTGTIVAENVVGNNRRRGARGAGIFVAGVATSGTVIERNWIGVTRAGAPVPNEGAGVRFWYDGGQTVVGPGNVIAHNAAGILLDTPGNDGVTITENAIWGNVGLGVELAPLGVNANAQHTVDTAANNAVEHPAIAGATPSEAWGLACALCRVEVFRGDGPAGAYGQGRAFAGSAVAASDGSFVVPVSDISVGDVVTATATSAGETSEFGLNIPVTEAGGPPPGTVVASDDFARQTSGGWGAAGSGGMYAVNGTAGDYAVSDGLATMQLEPAWTRSATLASVAARDVDASVRVVLRTLPGGAGQTSYLVLRRVGDNVEYRAKLLLTPDGRAHLQLARGYVTADGKKAETHVGPSVTVPGLIVTAHQPVWLRAQIFGSPTTIRMRAWREGDEEPAGWTLSRSGDSTGPQVAGGLGLRVYLPLESTTGRIQYCFDSYRVSTVDSVAPTDESLPVPAVTGGCEDRTPPTGTIAIADGSPYVRSSQVELSVPATDGPFGSGVTQVRIANEPALSTDGTLAGGTTLAYAETVPWQLAATTPDGAATDGTRTVYVQWRDAVGQWSAIQSAEVTLDTRAPTVRPPSISVPLGPNAGATAVPASVAWSATDETSGVAAYHLQQQTGSAAYRTVALPTAQTSGFTSLLAPDSTYRFRVDATDNAGNVRRAYGPFFIPRAHQETSSAIAYSGTWTRATLPDAYGGRVRYSTARGAVARFQFTGRSVGWMAQTSAARGRAEVWLDGVRVATVDLYSATPERRRIVWSRSWATSTAHTVEIRVLGTRRAAATSTRVDIDAFVVLQ
ncbi:hypothetical protein BH20CHL6_BH20CHL6_06710 [soil metagenome]